MRTNYRRALGILILWSILIVNSGIDLSLWEQLFVGAGVWLTSQEVGSK